MTASGMYNSGAQLGGVSIWMHGDPTGNKYLDFMNQCGGFWRFDAGLLSLLFMLDLHKYCGPHTHVLLKQQGCLCCCGCQLPPSLTSVVVLCSFG